METITFECGDCSAIIKIEEKNFDENRPIYETPEHCPYCGKRSLQ